MTGIAQLRESIQNCLANKVKAQDLPGVCVSLGLEPGEESEAFGSKRSYVRKRLVCLGNGTVMEIASKVQDRFPDPALDESIRKAGETEACSITELTRRKVLEVLAEPVRISGRLNIVDFLGRIFALEEYQSLQPIRFPSFSDEIDKHMNQNDDWDSGYLFERLGLLTCSEYRFVQFVELCIHPIVREADEQVKMVNRLNAVLEADGRLLAPADLLSGQTIYKLSKRTEGVAGVARNLIFAADGPKPEIVLNDAINNDVGIVKNAEYCLVYNRSIGPDGLRWGGLVDWWAEAEELQPRSRQAEETLYKRLRRSLGSPAELALFHHYFALYRESLGWNMPVLLPQVYLHFDPFTARMRRQMKILSRERMDFLLLLSQHERIVVEVDGKQHYAEDDIASPRLYAEMVSADRDLRLIGYELYRFGGRELTVEDPSPVTQSFFDRLFAKHNCVPQA